MVVAHCHLDANTKVHGLADYAGVRRDVIGPLIDGGFGIVQLPCPEATLLGMRRWGMTREQYDTPAYRRHCERILEPVIDTLVALVADGCSIESVIGVDGSPSCGVAFTCVGYSGGDIDDLFDSGNRPVASEASMPGIFMEVFRSLLATAGIEVTFCGVDESASGARG